MIVFFLDRIEVLFFVSFGYQIIFCSETELNYCFALLRKRCFYFLLQLCLC